MNITITNRITQECIQGGPEGGIALRMRHFTASEAPPAMLGVSNVLTRADLIKRKATVADVKRSTPPRNAGLTTVMPPKLRPARS